APSRPTTPRPPARGPWPSTAGRGRPAREGLTREPTRTRTPREGAPAELAQEARLRGGDAPAAAGRGRAGPAPGRRLGRPVARLPPRPPRARLVPARGLGGRAALDGGALGHQRA